MDSSVSPKDEIWFLSVCLHISTGLYQKYILPLITYSCESLVTAQPHTLKVLEHAQNQALRLIPGAVKTTPTDAMTFTTGNKLYRN
jgi:hypothetical protein